jgi:hypothetical protein
VIETLGFVASGSDSPDRRSPESGSDVDCATLTAAAIVACANLDQFEPPHRLAMSLKAMSPSGATLGGRQSTAQ